MGVAVPGAPPSRQARPGSGTVQPYVFGWLGSYLGSTGAQAGAWLDQGIDLAVTHYGTQVLGGYLGYPTDQMGWGTYGTLFTGVSMLTTFLTSQGRRLMRATLQYLGVRSDHEVGIVSWRDGKWSDVVGHTSVALIYKGQVITIMGLSPDPLPDDLSLSTLARLCAPGDGQVMDDRSMFDDHDAYIEIFPTSAEGWNAVQARVLRDVQNGVRYSLVGAGGSSCASWALSVAQVAGASGGTCLSRYLVSIPREIQLHAQKSLPEQSLHNRTSL